MAGACFLGRKCPRDSALECMRHGGAGGRRRGPRHPEPGYRLPNLGFYRGPLRYDKCAVRSERPIKTRGVTQAPLKLNQIQLILAGARPFCLALPVGGRTTYPDLLGQRPLRSLNFRVVLIYLALFRVRGLFQVSGFNNQSHQGWPTTHNCSDHQLCQWAASMLQML